MGETTSETTGDVVKYNPLKSRKFLLVTYIVLVNTIGYLGGKFLGIDVLSESAYVSLVTLVFTGYITANVSQKATAK